MDTTAVLPTTTVTLLGDELAVRIDNNLDIDGWDFEINGGPIRRLFGVVDCVRSHVALSAGRRVVSTYWFATAEDAALYYALASDPEAVEAWVQKHEAGR